MTFADVNNDKKLDLVYYSNGYLTIQLGNGDGTFQSPAYLAISSFSPVLVDLNGDGYLDIAPAWWPARNPTRLRRWLSMYEWRKHRTRCVRIAQVIRGFADRLQPGGGRLQRRWQTGPSGSHLLSLFPITTGALVFYGNGDGTLKPGEAQSLPPFGSFTVGDFNGDGVTDVGLIAGRCPQYPLYLGTDFAGQHKRNLHPGRCATRGGSWPVRRLGTPDLYKQSILPAMAILILWSETSVLNIFHGDGKGNFAATGSYGVDSPGGPFLFADVNGDGKQDLILANVAAAYCSGNGDSTFQAPPATPVAGLTADVNNDGIADMVFSLPQGGNIFGTALGRGDGTFAILDQTRLLPRRYRIR